MSFADPLLRITNGTDFVDLLSDEVGGVHLREYRPSVAIPKESQVFVSNPFSDGRRMITRPLDNAFDELIIDVAGHDQDAAVRRLQDLLRLLQQATDYWTAQWSSTPVWIEARAAFETNTRYGVIVDYRLPNTGQIFSEPFFNRPGERAVLDELAITIERMDWMDVEPETDAQASASNQTTYNGRTFGQEASAANWIYLANKHNIAQLTHLYTFDSPATYTQRLGTALPYSLLPTTPAAADIIYFGCDTSVADSGPFNSLVFDLSQAMSGVTGVWEYYNGGWVALSETGSLAGTGVREVFWGVKTDWVAVAVNGVTAFWVRFRVTSVAGPVTPRQQNRDPYTVTTPYVELAESAVGGDLPALARALLYDVTDTTFTRIYAALRSVSRGANFTPIINLSDEQNASGITVSESGASTSIVNSTNGPTGRAVLYNPAGVEVIGSGASISVSIASPLGEEYVGDFRVFVRGRRVGGAASDFTMRLRADNFGVVYDTVTWQDSWVDLGPVSFLASMGDENFSGFSLTIQLANSEGATPGDIYFTELIVLPVDEWAVQVNTGNGLNQFFQDYQVELSSIDPKRYFRATVLDITTGLRLTNWNHISPGRMILQSNARQRFWVVGTDISVVSPEYAHMLKIKLFKAQRYLSLRGDR